MHFPFRPSKRSVVTMRVVPATAGTSLSRTEIVTGIFSGVEVLSSLAIILRLSQVGCIYVSEQSCGIGEENMK